MKRRNPAQKPLLILLGLLLAGLLGAWIWYSAALGAPGGGQKAIVVKDGETPTAVADQLAKEKLIKSKTAFLWHVKSQKLADKFKSGRFVLSGKENADHIARDLTKPPAGNRITIAEGQTQEDIAGQLADLGVVKKPDFTDLKASDFAYDFLKAAPSDANLDGFLFPDTYELPTAGVTAQKIAMIFLNEFGKKLTPEWRSQVKQSGHSVYDTVIVASIVEKEVRSDADRRLVAGIIYKRLAKGIRLDVDATVHYGLGKPYAQALTQSDLNSDNPYNTRKVKGLPPGPISNPGLSSLGAAANPQTSDYLFYISDPKTGKTIFAKTNDEQDANVKKYLR